MLIRNIFSILAICSFISACSVGRHRNDQAVRTAADSFATSYFNYDLHKSIRFCTPSSAKWIHFAASNILQEDIDLLKQQQTKAIAETGDITYSTDTTASVSCEVTNFLLRDTLGRPGHMVEKMIFRIPVVLENGSWAVDAGHIIPERNNTDKN